MATREEFIRQYRPLAENIGKAVGVAPNLLLAQFGLETGWGRSVVPGTNNLGNIKDFSGGGVGATDNMTGSRDKYRKYGSPEEFGLDYVNLIGGNKRYAGALNTGDDAEAFARGLQAGGYAEDPDYVRKMVATAKAVGQTGGIGDTIAAAVLPSAQAAGNPFDQFDAPRPAVGAKTGGLVQPLSGGNVFDQFDATPQSGPTQYNTDTPPATTVPALPIERQDGAPAPANADTRGPDGVLRVNMSQQGEPTAPVSENGLVGLGAGLGAGVGQVALGAQRYLGRGLQEVGANTIGDWLVNDAVQGRAKLAAEVSPYKEVSPVMAGGGELAGNIAATLPVARLLGAGVNALAPVAGRAAPALNRLTESLRSGGILTGAPAATTTAGRLGDAAIRVAGGAGTGAVSAGLVNEGDVGLGATVGGAFPIAARAVGAGAQALGRSLTGGGVSDPVRNLAGRAAELGIDIPADRIANSKPLNSVAAGLNYVPFSGRAAVEDRMQDQLNTALTRTFGQNSKNVTQALRQARTDLGAEFDRVLRSTAVRVDDQLLDDLVAAGERATKELETGQAAIIKNQIDEILLKADSGVMDGQAAYNIKKTLDRIGKQNTPQAFYSDDLRRTLMEAMNRSMSPEAASAFAQTRKQYGNMLTLDRLAQGGADGNVSIARLGNLRDVRDPELRDLVDISAQFLKPRESSHSASQRAFATMGAAGAGAFGGAGALFGGIAAGRGVNKLLDSAMVRNAIMAQPGQSAITNSLMRLLPATSRAVPVISAQ